ncbi:MAG: RsmB/NOP family class I SAM-dependent RNA methyltransferase [Arachnia sp.]
MNPRRVAFDVLREVTGEGAYANLALSQRLRRESLATRDAGFVTELVAGTSRLLGTYDPIIERASGRRLSSLQPAVVDLLRLGAHQLLWLETPARAAVASTVDLARDTVGQRVTGLVNAVLRKVGARSLDEWTEQLAAGLDPLGSLAIKGHHPRWIAAAFAEKLPLDEVGALLAANNTPALPTLVVRPGLSERSELINAGAEPTRMSPFGATWRGSPSAVPAVAQGRAGVQDEGSQLVSLALTRAAAPDGPWLDMCAGPGGKAALLTGLAQQQGTWLLASEVAEHRARLVAAALSGYPGRSTRIITADGTLPAWKPGSFARVMVDAPCSGLGALRRRPESRWRRSEGDLSDLVPLQRRLLSRALDALAPGGVAAYVTCSPHPAETGQVVDAVLAGRDDAEPLPAGEVLPEVAEASEAEFLQLWPHRHGTDAMFLALIRRR